jgi:hypothetical protein
MARKTHAEAPVLEAPTLDEAFGPAVHADPDDAFGPLVHPDVAADNAKRNSVVGTKYKRRYAARAAAQGLGKAAQRSSWDWLAQTMAGEVLDEKDRLDVSKLLALFDANGVDHSKWTNRSKGWEGRLRMTGRLALQRVVAESGTLQTADGETLEAPAEWVAKFAR